MRFKSEDEIKKVLEIDSWKNLSKDKMIKFAAMMPDMDKEVIFKIIDQFPEFTKFAMEALNVMEKEHESTLTFNKQSQENVHQAYQEIREIFKGELNQDNLTSEEKIRLWELIMETGNKESEKDTENKQFLDGLFKKVAVGVGTAILTAVVFVGGKVLLQRGDD